MLDPQAQSLIQLLADNRVPAVNELSVADARKAYKDRRSYSQPEPPAMAAVQDLSIPTPGGALPVRLFRPTAQTTPQPALVYFHGGGWTIGDLDTHDVLCRQLAQASGAVVISVDYRLGPEHKFPAAYDDALAATREAFAQASAWGLDPQRIAVGGDSAGGNLAAAVCLGLRGTDCAPAFQLLIYPATQQKPDTHSYHANGEGYVLTKAAMHWFTDHYLRSDADVSDWRASPLAATDHSGLPPALVITAGYDPLRDEGLLYADALSRAGTACQYLCFERQIHGFITMGRIIDEANTAIELCGAALRRALPAR